MKYKELFKLLVPFLTNPLDTSTWEAMKVCGGAGKALLVVSELEDWSMAWSVVVLASLYCSSSW